jgi:hypothetical protein
VYVERRYALRCARFADGTGNKQMDHIKADTCPLDARISL